MKNSEMLKNIAVVMGYQAMGIKAYYELINNDEETQKKYDEILKKEGKLIADRTLILSKMDVLCSFLSLRILTDEDKKTLAKEMLDLSQKLCELEGV